MDLNQQYRERFDIAYQRIGDVYNHRNEKNLPFIIHDVNYWLGGETPDQIPDDYFSGRDFSVMFDYQMKKITSHVERYNDDYIPLVWHHCCPLSDGK